MGPGPGLRGAGCKGEGAQWEASGEEGWIGAHCFKGSIVRSWEGRKNKITMLEGRKEIGGRGETGMQKPRHLDKREIS